MNGTRKKALRQIVSETWAMLLLSVALVLFVEFFNHRTFAKLIAFLQEHPWMFLFNVQIIFNTFLFAEIWSRRGGVRLVVMISWMALGITNYLVASYRVLPFTTRDFFLIHDGLKMITVYFSWPEIIFMFGGIALLFAAIALLLLKWKKRGPFNRLAALTVFLLTTAATLIVGKVLTETHFVDWDKTSLVAAFRSYGFPYSFTYTFADMGIPKPDEYSEKLVEEIAVDIKDPNVPLIVEPEATLPPKTRFEAQTPNIVYVQLESFFNVHSILDAKFSEDPIPVFSDLMKNWPSGQLKVPSVGGGTANTEFEVLSGMNLDYFGAGEYPYNTVLQDTTCETVCFNLKPLGYTATAIHNYMGTFYGRNTVYSQLGFDRFVSQEYMNGLSFNALQWAKDGTLTGEVLKAMDTTPGRDFVFTVTVQSHGKYPSTPIEGLDRIDVTECGGAVDPAMFKNYVNELNEVDRFVGELIDALEELDEPIVLVLYGDHLPALGLEDSQLACGDMYQTTYAIWNNFGMDFEAPDLQAFQLTANVLGQLGVENGALMHFHQHYAADADDDNYLALLRVLEYDMLYGELAIYEGANPYQPTALQMGSVPIALTGAEYDASVGTLSARGENFTPCSDIVLNGARVNALFVDETHLIAKIDRPAEGSEVYVGQFAPGGEELSRTDPVKLPGN